MLDSFGRLLVINAKSPENEHDRSPDEFMLACDRPIVCGRFSCARVVLRRDVCASDVAVLATRAAFRDEPSFD
jgi:hypothetical protein